MILAEGKDKKIVINDIETYFQLVDLGFYDPDKKEWFEFEISWRKNDLLKFVNFYTKGYYDFCVGYNNINFDQNVMQYIVNNYTKWIDLTGEQIAEKVYSFKERHFENQNYGIAPRYKPEDFSIPAMDLMAIHHMDNKAKRCSLKWLEFMMNMKVEECSVPFEQIQLTSEEIDEIISYRKHDIKATHAFLYVTIGQPDKVMELNGGIPVPHLSDYNGMNMIQDRYDVMEETGLYCINWSDVKIGEEWNKLDYKKATGIEDDTVLMPKKIVYPEGQKFKKFFPKTMKFQTHKLNEFIKKVGEEPVRKYIINSKGKKVKQEFPITIGNTTYTIAKGGIHSTEKNRILIPPKGYKLRDADVGSQYPNSIVKYEIYAPHLDKIILGNFQGKIKLRITYKNKAGELKLQGLKIEARKFQSIQGLLKLCLNGGYYGKLGQEGSWLQFPEGLLRVCMGNQIEILMAIEAMELEEGFSVVSGNTDGFITMFPADKEDRYKELCKEWEIKVGNHELGKLEYVDYIGLWQRSINDYIGRYIDEKGNLHTKRKGSFVTTYGSPGCGINKNKSERVIPLALEAYFIDKKDPIEFIKNHTVIFDFLSAFKATKKMHYEEEWIEDSKIKTKKHKKLVVCYVTNNGTVLYKRGLNDNDEQMNNHCFAEDKNAPEIGQPLVRYFNEPFFPEKFSEYDVNYNYYIYKTLEIIDDLEKTKKAQSFLASLRNVKQINLF